MKKQIIIGILLLVIILGGCGIMEKLPNTTGQENNNQNNEENPGKNYKDAFYLPVQEHKGEEFARLAVGDKRLAIIADHREEVEKKVKEYFLDTFRTEVKLQNIVGTENGASVFVEAKGEPLFYYIAIVPVDIKKKEVRLDHISTIEGQVEKSIEGGLYVMAYREEFENLNRLLEEFEEEYPVTSKRQEVIERVRGDGYTTPHYFLTPVSDTFHTALNMYLENPEITDDELGDYFSKSEFAPEEVFIPIEFFMEEEEEPKEEILNKLAELIEGAEDIPRGSYHLYLHDNYIDIRVALGHKENTLSYEEPHGIKKE